MKKDEAKGVPSEEADDRTVAALGSLAGAASGAVVGAVGGPAGALIGAAIGSVVGGVAAKKTHEQTVERREHDEELDRDIGVTEGNIGEADPNAPPSKLGAFSRAAMGTSGNGEETPAEGPMQNIDD